MFCFQDVGLSVQNTQDTNWGLGEIGHSSNISSLQPKTIEGTMVYFDVLSSKMQEEQSNKVLHSSTGPFSIAFVCPPPPPRKQTYTPLLPTNIAQSRVQYDRHPLIILKLLWPFTVPNK